MPQPISLLAYLALFLIICLHVSAMLQLVQNYQILCMLQVNGGNKPKTNPKASVVFPPIKGDIAVRQKCREMIENSLTSNESSGMSFLSS